MNIYYFFYGVEKLTSVQVHTIESLHLALKNNNNKYMYTYMYAIRTSQELLAFVYRYNLVRCFFPLCRYLCAPKKNTIE